MGSIIGGKSVASGLEHTHHHCREENTLFPSAVCVRGTGVGVDTGATFVEFLDEAVLEFKQT